MTEENLSRDTDHYSRLALVSVHMHAGRTEEAASLLDELLSENPNDANAMHLSGMLDHQNGNSVSAIDKIRKAIKLLPDYPVFISNLGHIYLSLGKVKEAEQQLLEATKLDPDEVEPLYGLGECYRLMKDWQQAANVLGMALQRDREHVNSLLSLGRCHLNSGMQTGVTDSFIKARELFEMLLAIEPDHWKGRFQLARACYACEDYQAARELLEKMAVEQPANIAVLNNLGNTYMALHDNERAVTAYRAVMNLEPDNALFIYNLAVALVSSGESSEAIELLQRACEMSPENERMSALLAQLTE